VAGKAAQPKDPTLEGLVITIVPDLPMRLEVKPPKAIVLVAF